MKTTLSIKKGILSKYDISIISDDGSGTLDGFRILATLEANALEFSTNHEKIYYYTATNCFITETSVFSGHFTLKEYDVIEIQEGLEIPTEGGDE